MDANQLQLLYDEHGSMVYNLALHYLQNTHDAEEVTQDVFVKVHKKYSSFEQKANIKTWIYKLTVNQSLDYIKSKKAKKRLGFLFSLNMGEEHSLPEPGHMNHPGLIMEQQEAVELIMHQINQLPPNQKTAIILKSIECLSQTEIAEIMELSVKAIESLLSRARSRLKNKLGSSEGI